MVITRTPLVSTYSKNERSAACVQPRPIIQERVGLEVPGGLGKIAVLPFQLEAGEIEALDPELFSQWRDPGNRPGFDYPEGERRADFCERVRRGVDAWVAAEAQTLLAVAHKGVIRVAVEHLTGVPLEEGEPALGSVLVLESGGSRGWQRTDPESD